MKSDRWVMLAILGGGAALMLLGIQWGLPNFESWSGDDISPDKPLRVAHDWWQGHHKYPYLHWWLSLALYSPYLLALEVAGEVDLGCLPKLHPGCFQHPVTHMTVLMVLSRLLAVSMALGTAFATRHLTRSLVADPRAGWVAAAVVAGSYAVVFFAHTGNLDVPHTFWLTLSLVAAVQVWKRGSVRDHALFGVAAGCALATKDSILGALVGVGLALLARHFARARGEGAGWLSACRDRRVVWLVAPVVVVYGLVQNALFNPSGLLAHWDAWIAGGETLRALRENDTGPVALLGGLTTALRSDVGLPVLVLAGVGVGVALVRPHLRIALLLLGPVASYFLLSIVPAGFVAPRLVLPLVPIIAVFAGIAAAAGLGVRRPALRACALAAVLLALGHEWLEALNGDLRLLGDSRYAAEAWLSENVPPGTTVMALGGSEMFPRIDRLGLEIEPLAAGEFDAERLRAEAPEWVLLSSLYRPKQRLQLIEELCAGRQGYERAWESQTRTWLDRWFDTPRHAGAVNPRLTVLRRVPGSPAGRTS